MKIAKKLAVAACVASAFTMMNTQAEETKAPVSVSQAGTALPAGVTQGPSIEGVTEYRLVNGLRVVLFPDASKDTATVNMTYLVGSRQENYGETGMAHLLEHLIFKGSKNFPNPTKEFTNRGFRMNGSTWLDRTNYYVSFTATEDNLKFALAWSADAMRNSFIAKKDLDSEMSVVRNEYEMGENRPSSVLMKRMQSMMYDWHNYGKSTIGNRSDIEHVRIENLQAFYHRYYRPDNAVLTVSGKFDVQKTLEWIVKDFSLIQNPKEALPAEWTVEPTADGERVFEIRRKGETQMVAVGYRIPSALHPDALGVEVATEVLADSPNGRLYDALVKTGLAANVFGYAVGAKEPGFVIFGASVKKGESLEKVKDKLIETIEGSLKQKPVTSKELTRTKAQMETMYERAFADPEGFGVGLSEYIALGDWRLFFYGRDKTKDVTAQQADSAADKYFVRDNRVVGLFIPDDNPQRAEITKAPSAEELLANYKPQGAAQKIEAFDSSFDNLDKRTQRIDIGDLNIALLPKQTRGETVTVCMKFKSGDEKNLFGKSSLQPVAAAMLTRGTKTMTRSEIEDRMTELKMAGSITNFTTTRKNLPAALELVFDVMHNSIMPQDEFDQFKKQMQVMIESMRDKPDALAQNAITQHFNTYPKGDPRHEYSLDESLEQLNRLTVDQVRAFYKEFGGTSRGEISIVGDFDPKAVEKIIRDDYAKYVSKAHYAPIVTEYRPVQATRVVIDTPDKENATIVARSVFPINDTSPDAPALTVANWILGGGTGLSNRLIERLRQKEGLSYGAGSHVRIPAKGDNGSFVFRAIVAPQNMLQAEASARDVIAKAIKDGFTDQEVEEAKKGLLQAMQVARSQDDVVARSWNDKMENQSTWVFSKKQAEAISKLTTADVNAALRKYIKPDEITFVLAGDQKKAAQKKQD